MSAAVLRTPEAAKYIGLSISTMTKMRLRGPRCVGYCVSDLDLWLEARRRASTSDQGAMNSAHD